LSESARASAGASQLRVWGVGTSRTFRVHWTLQELALDYETVAYESRTGETCTESFLRLNPRGKIPVLQHGDLVLAESAAIALYLAEHFGGTRALLPAPGGADRALHEMWCYFVMTELDATSLYVLRRHGDLSALYGEAPAALDAARENFRRQAAVAEETLADGRAQLTGDSFRICDILLTSCLDWARFYGETLSAPLEAYRERNSSRDGYAKAFEANFPKDVLARLREQRQASSGRTER